MRTWSFARQKSRKGPWEELARDRDRFQRRIRDSEQILGRCLTPSHRQKVRAGLEQEAQEQAAATCTSELQAQLSFDV